MDLSSILEFLDKQSKSAGDVMTSTIDKALAPSTEQYPYPPRETLKALGRMIFPPGKKELTEQDIQDMVVSMALPLYRFEQRPVRAGKFQGAFHNEGPLAGPTFPTTVEDAATPGTILKNRLASRPPPLRASEFLNHPLHGQGKRKFFYNEGVLKPEDFKLAKEAMIDNPGLLRMFILPDEAVRAATYLDDFQTVLSKEDVLKYLRSRQGRMATIEDLNKLMNKENPLSETLSKSTKPKEKQLSLFKDMLTSERGSFSNEEIKNLRREESTLWKGKKAKQRGSLEISTEPKVESQTGGYVQKRVRDPRTGEESIVWVNPADELRYKE